MRIMKIDISQIEFNYQKYSQTLYQSVLRISYFCQSGKSTLHLCGWT